MDELKVELEETKDLLAAEKSKKDQMVNKKTCISPEVQNLKEELHECKLKIAELKSELASCYDRLSKAEKQQHSSPKIAFTVVAKQTSSKATQTDEYIRSNSPVGVNEGYRVHSPPIITDIPLSKLDECHTASTKPQKVQETSASNSPRRAADQAARPPQNLRRYLSKTLAKPRSSNRLRSDYRERQSSKIKTHRVTRNVSGLEDSMEGNTNACHSKSNSISLAEAGSIRECIMENRKLRRRDMSIQDICQTSLPVVSRAPPTDGTGLLSNRQAATEQLLFTKVTEFLNLYSQRLTAMLDWLKPTGQLATLALFREWEQKVNLEKGRILRKLNLIADYCSQDSSKAVQCSNVLSHTISGNAGSMNDNKHHRSRMVKGFNGLKESYLLLWGDSSHGKIGLVGKQTVPTPTYFPHGQFKSIALGESFSAAVDTKGRLFTWGRGEFLGVETVDRSRPLLVKGLSSRLIGAVRCGRAHILSLSVDGVVFSWVNALYGRATISSGSSAMESTSHFKRLLSRSLN